MNPIGRVFGNLVYLGKRGGRYIRRGPRKVYLNEHERLLMRPTTATPQTIEQLPVDLAAIVLDYKRQLESPVSATQVFCMLCTDLERSKVVNKFLQYYHPVHLMFLHSFALASYGRGSRLYEKATKTLTHW